jgi:hypothetical protein
MRILHRIAPALFSLTPALVQAPAVAQAPAAAEDPVDARTLDRRRLLMLEDGRVLRARSRLEGETWLVRDGRDWELLDSVVASAKDERDVLAEARALEARLTKDDHRLRVALAGWMVDQGLFPEALRQLDRVLGAEPEHPAALALVRENPIPLEIESAPQDGQLGYLTALVKQAAGGSDATREVCVQLLADMQGALDLRKVLASELTCSQNRRREFAALASRRLFKGELLRELADRALLDAHRPVRAEAARALRDTEDVGVLGPAINALSSKHANVRANAAEALGNMGFKAAVEPLVKHLAALRAGGGPSGTRANVYIGEQTAYVADYDVEIAQGASIADPIVQTVSSGVIFDVRAQAQISQVIEMRSVIGALERLTNAKVPSNPRAWERWWEEHESQWRSRAHALRPSTER